MFERELLKEVQKHIPIVERPFRSVADRLGVSEGMVIDTLRKLKEDKVIRQISPIYDTRAVGYDSSLVAFRVPAERLHEVASFISTHPGVSHNYEREHEFNLWFTLAVPPDGELSLEETVSLMAELSGVDSYVILRTVKTYKIGVKLDYGNLREREKVEAVDRKAKGDIDEEDKRTIYVTQRDIPLVEEPFKLLAEELDTDVRELLKRLNRFKEEGLMRRFSAILFHRKAGFKANGMAVWRVPEERLDEAGLTLASFRSVSHCYQRTTNEVWRFNLFSMIHGRTRDEVLNFVEEVKSQVKPEDYDVLFSRTEFKKKRVELFSEEFYEWEKKHVGAHSH
ncbi:siroheme decarboxylase subunit alpha [Hydrogenivirga sp.]